MYYFTCVMYVVLLPGLVVMCPRLQAQVDDGNKMEPGQARDVAGLGRNWVMTNQKAAWSHEETEPGRAAAASPVVNTGLTRRSRVSSSHEKDKEHERHGTLLLLHTRSEVVISILIKLGLLFVLIKRSSARVRLHFVQINSLLTLLLVILVRCICSRLFFLHAFAQ